MDIEVPTQVRQELIQILSNLVLGDNEIRATYVSSASALQNGNLTSLMTLYLLALKRQLTNVWLKVRSHTC
jgi:importin-5